MTLYQFQLLVDDDDDETKFFHNKRNIETTEGRVSSFVFDS